MNIVVCQEENICQLSYLIANRYFILNHFDLTELLKTLMMQYIQVTYKLDAGAFARMDFTKITPPPVRIRPVVKAFLPFEQLLLKDCSSLIFPSFCTLLNFIIGVHKYSNLHSKDEAQKTFRKQSKYSNFRPVVKVRKKFNGLSEAEKSKLFQ